MNRQLPNPRMIDWQTADPLRRPPKEDRSRREDQQHEIPVIPSWTATSCFVAILAITAMTLDGESGSAVARYAASGSAFGLTVLMVIELLRGWRQIFRADILMLVGVYFLTLFEFLFAQPKFDGLVGLKSANNAVLVCFVGYVGIAVGRHCGIAPSRWLVGFLQRPTGSSVTFQVLALTFFGGFFYIFSCVSFDPVAFFHAIIAPRFSQPWTRDELGDWKALLFETSMLIFLVPPVCGIILARRKQFPWQSCFAAFALLFTLFYGFATGTRSFFATYVITFLGGYCFALPKSHKWEAIFITLLSGLILLGAFVAMLDFRDIGLKQYIETGSEPRVETESEFFVDYNLWAIATIVETFPEKEGYLWLEIPYITLIRPIPRALWSSKPTGLSVSIEKYAGVEGMMTMASTFIGEAYMSLGYLGVLVFGIVFGLIGRWWSNYINGATSPHGILIYSSGLFATVICMRSMTAFTTAILPTLAAVCLAAILLRPAQPACGA